MNQYKRPELVEYGRINELTLGATGNKLDYDLVNGKLQASADPTCNTNANYGCLNVYVS